LKHERNIEPAPRKNWRLKKTLARRTQIRELDASDVKYLWASYKKGALAAMGAAFADGQMNPDQFKEAFENAAQNYSEGWIVLAETKKGFIPAGVVLGKLDSLLPFMIVGGVAWFPWATHRNIVEGTVAFFDAMRRQIPCIGFAVGDHKRLYEICCMHGIMRRVGTSQIVVPGQAAAVFETRIQA
jgi:hypothetical protein